jgi:DNA-binding winged helix-turn-helix (wHTH) protein/tetratricopeptide (TPR) repeat protein
MASPAQPPSVICFGQFELDATNGELRKAGISLKIHPQPFQVLQLLAGRPKQIVTREEIRSALWGDNTFVDFERGINSCVNQIRVTLGDDPEKPRYVETLPRRGYRFVAAVTEGSFQQIANVIPVSLSPECDNGSQQATHTLGVPFVLPSTRNSAETWKAKAAIAALVVFGLLIIAAMFYFRSPAKLTGKHSIVLADFINATGDEVFDDTLKQALAVDLGQSPFLNIVSEETVRQTLRRMTRSPSERLTQDLAREVCQRAGSSAYLAGSISALGTQYVIGMEALNCASGDVLAREQVTATGKEQVLPMLGRAAAKLRKEVGESLSSVKKFDVPLEQATTDSLEALKAFTIGRKTENEKGYAKAVPFDKRAIGLDPNFALAYEALGNDYYSMDEHGLGAAYLKKAFDLSDRVTEREKFHIIGLYYSIATGELEKSSQTYELWIQVYPRDAVPYINLGNNDMVLGKYEKAATETSESLRLGDWTLPYENLGQIYIALNRFDEARTTTEVALARKLNGIGLHVNLYALAFFEGNMAALKHQANWAVEGLDGEDQMLSLESDTEAWCGRLGKARELSRQAVERARRNDETEPAALWQANMAIREALFGNADAARQNAAATVGIEPRSRDAKSQAALAYALGDDIVHAELLADDLAKAFPQDTVVQSVWLPTIRAQIEIDRKKPAESIELLQAALPYDLGMLSGSAPNSCLYPVYIRAEAYLSARQGLAAAVEFERILDHRGLVWNCATGALAHLGLARAYVLQGETAKARAAYQDFLTLWKDADSDIPIVTAAKAEYAKLQ